MTVRNTEIFLCIMYLLRTRGRREAGCTDKRTTSEDVVARIIQKSPKISCTLDPIPTWFLDTCKATFTPTITPNVNSSINGAFVPELLKSISQKEEFESYAEELSFSFEPKIHI